MILKRTKNNQNHYGHKLNNKSNNINKNKLINCWDFSKQIMLKTMLKTIKLRIFWLIWNKKYKNLKNKKIGRKSKWKGSIRENNNVKEKEINNKKTIMMIKWQISVQNPTADQLQVKRHSKRLSNSNQRKKSNNNGTSLPQVRSPVSLT